MKNALITEVKRFVKEEEGTEVVEWALVAGLIVAVGAGIFVLIGGEVDFHLNEILEALQRRPAGGE